MQVKGNNGSKIKFVVGVLHYLLTFRHHASYIYDRRTAIPQSTLFIYSVNKYI